MHPHAPAAYTWYVMRSEKQGWRIGIAIAIVLAAVAYLATPEASFVTGEARDVRAASRSKVAPATKIADIGFRCAR